MPAGDDDRPVLDPERASYLRVRGQELRQAQHLARRAEERIASPEYQALRAEMLDLLTAWNDGDSGDKAIALIAQVARIARAVKAPLNLIAEAKRLAEDLAQARKEWGVANDYEPPDDPGDDLTNL